MNNPFQNFVISDRNPEYTPLNDESPFWYWSNQDGWVSLETATKFSSDELREINLPLGNNPVLISWVNENEDMSVICIDNFVDALERI